MKDEKQFVMFFATQTQSSFANKHLATDQCNWIESKSVIHWKNKSDKSSLNQLWLSYCKLVEELNAFSSLQ